ncbi:MAG: hypothetical protein Terrestrivirus12_15 [Terrestrivirus sp.]|uniref:Methyltransferase n=1 Tax=Terrestrivirus sp. TaxID=2487775 RepID=A0A3G4ZP92_9VIRU|nr:MAG: hypothetical protein Terrestrivirus12_15 [Terrestrivirus sp.]
MKPWFASNDEKMFYKYLDKAENYFEYGSGGSTYQASIRKNVKSIYSVESDLEWHNKLKDLIEDKERISFIYCDMKTQPNTLGNPGKSSTLEDWINYSNGMRNLNKLDTNLTQKIDLILIDGRFRVACCLKCFDIINDDCYIIYDDFLNRPDYHVVLNYYDVIEKTRDERMVILKKKQCQGPSSDLIEKYEKIRY